MANIETSRYEEEDEDSMEETHIRWSNLIFLPFHPLFQMFVMLSVVTKIFLGPLQSVYPVVYCWTDMDEGGYFLASVKFFYYYCADPIYGIDTFLYIVHRQVTDEAVKREYIPKSGACLMLDFASLIPLYRLAASSDCPEAQLWPNILAFSESCILYRVIDYFKLRTTHSGWNLSLGFVLLSFLILNCVSCFWILLTYNGFCKSCKNYSYDWRHTVQYKFNETGYSHSTYIYGMVFMFCSLTNKNLDDLRPFTIQEYIGFDILNIVGYLIVMGILVPKMFAESVLSNKKINAAYPIVKRFVEESKRRNPSQNTWKCVKKFYDIMWKKHNGITRMPDLLGQLPRCVRVDVMQDLAWPLFQHSPTLKKVSTSMRRYICSSVIQEFKLPGERFFSGPKSYSHIYYIKSGVVQFLSEDEGMTPILSVTSGTIFGDVSFMIPPFKRKVIIKCLTYCEVLYISRYNYIASLHRFPDDRREIHRSVMAKLRHAKTLNALKRRAKGLDRAEIEGFYWIRKRWWELTDYITIWKKRSRKNLHAVCELPSEQTYYHCAKYIGQLVLCTQAQLLTKSLFANVRFPWLFVPNSKFINVWRKVVLVTVILVVLVFPPSLTNAAQTVSTEFRFFRIITDSIYAADIGLSILTVMTGQESTEINFISVIFARFKTFNFYLDLIATIWIEYLVAIIGMPEFFLAAQYNRLIKMYIFFTGEFTPNDLKRDPTYKVFYYLFLWQSCFMYISSYVIYFIHLFVPDVTTNYFFGKKYCEYTNPDLCDPGAKNALAIFVSFMIEIFMFSENNPEKLIDTYIAVVHASICFLISVFCMSSFTSAMYLKYRDEITFRKFVTNLKSYYEYYKIHKSLLKRLDRYLICHWKYYKGAEIMTPNMLRNEPFDIYWRVQGEVAERIIGQSQAFLHADPALVRDLACAAKFLILPKNSTLSMFGVQCQNVTWLVQGSVKCEYHDENDDLFKVFYSPGVMLSITSVFFGKASLRTYTASTDCEVLYIRIQDFYKIIKQYPAEWSHLERCITEFSPIFDKMSLSYTKIHKEYQERLRNSIFHAGMSTVAVKKLANFNEDAENRSTLLIEHDFWTEPESNFTKGWMALRAFIVIVSIVNATIQGGSGAVYRRLFTMVGAFCDCIGWIDIVLKLFLAYYDQHGILIYDKKKCMLHYLTRSFWLDIIGAMPWTTLINDVISANYILVNDLMLMNSMFKFAHVYIILGYCNYLSDRPTINAVFIKIFKWQLFVLLAMFVATHYLLTYCIKFEFDHLNTLVEFKYVDTCWLPSFFERDFEREGTNNMNKLHMIYAQSINMAQCGLVGTNIGAFRVTEKNLRVGIVMGGLMLIFWLVTGFSLALLVLSFRGNTLFQHGVSQLINFLQSERVDSNLINRAVQHFTYWWIRTKGINIQHLTNEGVGAVFRQDLNFFFFRETFLLLNTILHGGEDLNRQLASCCTQCYMLPGDEVVREMDLTSSVYLVHRGKILVMKDGEVVTTLAKGSIFGQLNSAKTHPLRISAMSEDYSDLLQISIAQFHETITDEVRKVIAEHPTSEHDYIATKKDYAEDPYDSIQYILKGRKSILIPLMSAPLIARRGTWYYRWLYMVWFIEPVLTVASVLLVKTVPQHILLRMYYVLAFLDLIYLTNFIAEFFCLRLVVVDNKCVRKILGWQRLKSFVVYLDAATLLVPLLTFLTGDITYQLIRILRLRHLYSFHAVFCTSFKSKKNPVILKMVIFFLILHALSCGWMIVACSGPFPLPTPTHLLMSTQNKSSSVHFDVDEWVFPENRIGGNKGCARMILNEDTETQKPIFVVPYHWYYDYMVAFTYTIMIYTHVAVKTIMPITISEIYYHIFMTFVIFVADVWLMSVIIIYLVTKFRELYLYEFNVSNLITYLKDSGLPSVLIESVTKYTSSLWSRQEGRQLPELAKQAPLCLREDLFSSLYMHHLDAPPLLRNLPDYFKRQLVTRLKRLVIFPGKWIVQSGDICPCIYFIHEGEVEKWFTDKTGELRLMTLYTINGFFGLIPGIFSDIPFVFSYYSRTVVDVILLELVDWQDLMDSYPAVKLDLYTRASQLKRDTYIVN